MDECISHIERARDEVSLWKGGSFHANLRNSDTLNPQLRKSYIDIKDASPRVQDVYERVLPYYEFMNQNRITVS